MGNNTAKRTIRLFTVGQKNWVTINNVAGSQEIAIIYSIAETTKANGLNIYQYFEFPFTKLPKHEPYALHLNDKDTRFLSELLPRSDTVQKQCHAAKSLIRFQSTYMIKSPAQAAE